jgi:Aminotransferase ubiquitination site
MNIETIKTYRIHMNATGKMPLLDIHVKVDGRDLPQARGIFIADIFIDRVIHHLSELFGLDKVEVARIRKELEEGRAVDIEVPALHTQLIQAGFIQG